MFHLVRSSNDKAGTGIVKAFKYAFEYGMVQLVPTYLCDTCPIRQLNMVCKELSSKFIHVYMYTVLIEYVSKFIHVYLYVSYINIYLY